MIDQRKRRQNEAKFDSWDELPDGGRRYRLEVRGRKGWLALYLKQVDASENTVRFWQEIRDAEGQMVEIHEKYPQDRGHRRLPGKDR
jgi:hypothetical protein